MYSRIAAIILLLLLFPLLLIISLAIRLDSPGPVIFKQKRVGQYRKYFTIYKFRTMVVGMPDLPSALVSEDDNRFTRLGRLLRRLSLDELPQLFNIVRGEMVFVGPRPALYNQDDLIVLREHYGVYALKPGVTGWAQINGREMVSIDEKVHLDYYYLQNHSLYLDIRIIFKTITNCFRGEDLYLSSRQYSNGGETVSDYNKNQMT